MTPVISRKLIPFLAAVILLPGCGKQKEQPLGEARPVPAKSDEGGWPLYEQPADGFAIALPPGWTTLNLDPKTLDRTLERNIGINPDFKAMEQGIRQQAAAGIKFLGTEKAGGGPNVTIMKVPVPGEANLDAAAADWVKQFDALPSVEKPVARRRVRLLAGEAERMDIVLPVNPPGGVAIRLAMNAYLLVRGGDLYVVNITAGVDEAARYKSTFERVVQSFRFLGK